MMRSTLGSVLAAAVLSGCGYSKDYEGSGGRFPSSRSGPTRALPGR